MIGHSDNTKQLVNAANENQETALHLAVNKGLEIVRLLIENSSFVSAINKDRKRPLDLAIQNQKRNVAVLLTRFDVLQQSGFTIDISEDPESLHALVVFDDFSAIDSFLQVIPTLH
jgi:ankyrin repeat protein